MSEDVIGPELGLSESEIARLESADWVRAKFARRQTEIGGGLGPKIESEAGLA